MKRNRGFTLIELMIVVAVLVTLMAIMFRIMGIGADKEAMAKTQRHLQGVNNALSGYFAAFGTYPPVKLQGARDIFSQVDVYGVQYGQNDRRDNTLKWSNVKAACRSQPVGVYFPFSDNSMKAVENLSNELKELCQMDGEEFKKYRDNAEVLMRGFDGLTRKSEISIGGRSDTSETDGTKTADWKHVQVFRFGLLSFLLPRYMFMTRAATARPWLYDDMAQWLENNEDQREHHGDGRTIYRWQRMAYDMNEGHRRYVAMIPSQAVCARWMPNFEGIIRYGETFFGIDTVERDADGVAYGRLSPENAYPEVFCPSGNPSGQYMLDKMDVLDGWGNSLYYYSAAPYQGYDLWSSGKNGKTFPPWIPTTQAEFNRIGLSGSDLETALSWKSDDVR